MKILIISSLYKVTPSNGVGSIENFVHHLSTSLVRDYDIDVCLVTKEGSLGGIYNQVHANYENLDAIVLQEINNFKPDIIHFHIDSSTLFYKLKNSKIPVIFTLHDGTLHSGSGWVKDIPNSGNNFIYTTVSRAVKDYLTQLLYSRGFLFNTQKIYELGIGIEVAKFSQRKDVSHAVQAYLFMGLIRSYRAVFELVSFFGKLEDKRLVVAGPMKQDPYADLVKSEIAKYTNVSYIGEVVGLKDKIDVLRNCIALINPAGYSTLYPNSFEAFGVTMLEANATGKPIIGYNKGNISDYIKQGVNGYLFNSLSEVRDLMSLCEKQDLYEGCVKMASFYDISKIIPNYHKLYSEIYAGENFYLLG